MTDLTAAPHRTFRLRFTRASEWHLVELSVCRQQRNEQIHLNVVAVYEDGSLVNLKGRQVAAMGAQYTARELGDPGQVNLGDLESDRVDVTTGCLRGMGLGSAMFCELVVELHELPAVPVAVLYLSEEDADDGNRERRNRFYERFGITFNFYAGGRHGAESVNMSSHDLLPAEPSDHQSWVITKTT